MIDQQQPIIDATAGFTIAIGGSSEQKLAQVVTTGITGILTEVCLPVGGSGGLLVEIQEVTGDLPNGVVLTSEVIPSFPPPFTPEFRSLVFSSPIFFSEGDRFAIVLSSLHSFAVFPGPQGDPYPGGDGYFDSRSNQPGVWVRLGDFGRADLPFQTIVIPEPSTLVLLGVGAIGLLGWAWRRWKYT